MPNIQSPRSPNKLVRRILLALIPLLCAASALTTILQRTEAQSGAEYDIVIDNGRIMDPASNLDAVRHLGIRGKSIAAISTTKLRGRTG
jgi:hypothetical protein